MSTATDSTDILDADADAAAGLSWTLTEFQSAAGGHTRLGLSPAGADQQTLINARMRAASAVRAIGSDEVRAYRSDSEPMQAWRAAWQSLYLHRQRVEETRAAHQHARGEASGAVQKGQDPGEPLARGRQLAAELADLLSLNAAYELRHSQAREAAQRGYEAVQREAHRKAAASAGKRHDEAKRQLLRLAGDAVAGLLVATAALDNARSLSVAELPAQPPDR